MKKKKVERLQPQASEEKIFDPWLVMNPDRMETILTDKAKVRACIMKAIVSNSKAIEKYCNDLKNGEGGGNAGTVYRCPSSSYGMAVQKSDISDPVFDTLMMAEQFQAKRILRLLKINETWEIMELGLMYVDQKILFLKKEDQVFIEDIFYKRYNVSLYSYKLHTTESCIYKRKTRLLMKLCDIYDEYVLFLREESRIKEKMDSHYKLLWNDFDDLYDRVMLDVPAIAFDLKD